MTEDIYKLVGRFRRLFTGLDTAYGTGRGQWVKRAPTNENFVRHLSGEGVGIGIAPLMPDNNVWFAAIDLDEPDFAAAFEMQRYIPGASFVERSRSGNAHVWVFFKTPCPAWLAMGVLREAFLAAGKKGVEVFPKNHDFARVKLGNYINLPYHGSDRPILWPWPDAQGNLPPALTLEDFLTVAEDGKNDPEDWRRRAALMLITPPDTNRERSEFGEQANLHICAERIISGEAGPILEGTRNAVFFMLAKCLLNWTQVDYDEAWSMLLSVNDDLCSPPEDERELRRILDNVDRGRYTSTGCDDPLVSQYAHPDCRIANPRR